MQVPDLTVRSVGVFEVPAWHHAAELAIHSNIVFPAHDSCIEFSGLDRIV
jgi:hypothetical protein